MLCYNVHMHTNTIKQIAVISNDLKEKFGTPRQSGRAPSLISKITFLPEYRSLDAVRGLQEFSHVWLIFDFTLSRQERWSPLIRPPRLGGNEKTGVFASRSPFRPNNLGLSSVKLIKVDCLDKEAPVLYVSGADLIDGTPIYDIKPYIPLSDCHVDAKGGFSDENKDYKLKVVIPENLQSLLQEQKMQALIECLSDDPRPAYHCDDRPYGMTYADTNVKFCVNNGTLTVLSIEKIK